jgi:hypothetical protein
VTPGPWRWSARGRGLRRLGVALGRFARVLTWPRNDRAFDLEAVLAAADAASERADLPARLLTAAMTTTGSDRGALLGLLPGGWFRPLATSGMAIVPPPGPSAAEPLRRARRPLAWDERKGVHLPHGLGRLPGAGVAVPLIWARKLRGVLLLGREGAAAGASAGSLIGLGALIAACLADDGRTGEAEALSPEQLDHRPTFLLHDLKQVVSPLSLALANARTHRRDPAFVDDLIQTLEAAVTRAERLLARLRPPGRPRPRAIDLAAALTRIAGSRLDESVEIIGPLPHLHAAVDPEPLASVLDHLIDNAIEAAGHDGRVELRLVQAGDMAVIAVRDDGPGMDPAFVRERLFRPFASTKPGGFGIGVYQARRFAEAAEGFLEAQSVRGRGTEMRLGLPLAAVPATTLARA